MLDPIKIAQIFNKEKDNLIIWRKKENLYWLSNNYLLAALDKEEYQKFNDKYDSYKGKVSIPALEVGKKIYLKENNFLPIELNFQSTIDTKKGNVKVEIADILIEKKGKFLNILISDTVDLLKNEYVNKLDLKKYFCLTKEGENQAINIYEDENYKKIIGIVMPIRKNKEKVIEKLKKITNILY